jgi:hypothetical protein
MAHVHSFSKPQDDFVFSGKLTECYSENDHKISHLKG